MRFLVFSMCAALAVFLHSCGDDEIATEDLVAKGGKEYGGEFTFMTQEKINVLIPAFVGDIYNSRMISQIYDPMMIYDPITESVLPNVAESYTKSADSKLYTFKIRKGIKFHKDDCFDGVETELTAKDVKFTLEMACSGLKKNQISHMLMDRIAGAKAFNAKTKNKTSIGSEHVSGITVVDDYTLKISLVSPTSDFAVILTNPSLGIVSKQAFDHYGSEIEKHAVGSGPFSLESITSDLVTLKRHPNYWKKDEFGNQLPFLSKVIIKHAKNKKSEFTAFGKGEIDLVLEIPVENIENILGSLKDAQSGKNIKHKVDGEESLSISYIAMACESAEFKDPRVRRAFNLAIDRDDLVDNWLEGEGWVADHGFTPNMANYDNSTVKGHTFNPTEAKALMSAAGYANGANFPKIDFYVNAQEGSGMHIMCKGIAHQLKEQLNVNLNIKLCSIEQREAAIASGKAKIWRAGWVADYPDPENFLSLFYSGNVKGNTSQINTFKFRSPNFDQLFIQACTEENPEKRAQLFNKCDQIVIDEAAVIPILTDDHVVMINARVRNFKASPLESLNLTSVYIKTPARK